MKFKSFFCLAILSFVSLMGCNSGKTPQEHVHNYDKDNIDLIKYTTPVKGSTRNYNSIVNYIYSHDMANKNNYEYVKNQIDIEELCNYWIVQSYYGNTDLGNIRYWKANTGKWRWMIYDLDWSLWSSSTRFAYPVVGYDSPGVTYLSSAVDISKRLYRNSE